MSGSLDDSPADVIRRLLISLGQGTLPEDNLDFPINRSQESNKPDDVITCYDTTGTDDGRTNPDNERQEHHGVQVRVRSDDYTTGYTKTRALAVALDGVTGENVTVGLNTYIVKSVVRGDVLSLGKDKPQGGRNLFTVNLVASLRQTS